jgi:hypothetical protein
LIRPTPHTPFFQPDCARTPIRSGFGHSAATVLGPTPPVPAPYTSWVDVPPSIVYASPVPFDTPPNFPNLMAVQASCLAQWSLAAVPPNHTVAFGYPISAATELGNLRADLWTCILLDTSTNPPTQVLPL